MEIKFPEGYCPMKGLITYLYSVTDETAQDHDEEDTLTWAQNISKRFELETSLFFVAHYYVRCYITFMKRIMNMDTITFDMLQELMALSLMIASKAYHDKPRSNFTWMLTFPDLFCKGCEYFDNENVDPTMKRTVQEMGRLENLNNSEFCMFDQVLQHQVIMSEEMIEEMMNVL